MDKPPFTFFPAVIKPSMEGRIFSDNKWHHLAATLGADGMKLYVDGNLSGF
jgi:hypothetical protein